MGADRQTRFRNGGPTVVGSAHAFVVLAAFALNGSLDGHGVSSVTELYVLAAGCITFGLITGRRVVSSWR